MAKKCVKLNSEATKNPTEEALIEKYTVCPEVVEKMKTIDLSKYSNLEDTKITWTGYTIAELKFMIKMIKAVGCEDFELDEFLGDTPPPPPKEEEPASCTTPFINMYFSGEFLEEKHPLAGTDLPISIASFYNKKDMLNENREQKLREMYAEQLKDYYEQPDNLLTKEEFFEIIREFEGGEEFLAKYYDPKSPEYIGDKLWARSTRDEPFEFIYDFRRQYKPGYVQAKARDRALIEAFRAGFDNEFEHRAFLNGEVYNKTYTKKDASTANVCTSISYEKD